MEFLKKLFGRKPKDKIGFIRELVKERVENDAFARHLVELESLSDFELMGLPEGTIVSIVESYMILTQKQGISPEEALGLIENHRATSISGDLPTPLTLRNYIRYRLNLEHSHGAPLTEAFVDKTIEKTRTFFSKFL